MLLPRDVILVSLSLSAFPLVTGKREGNEDSGEEMLVRRHDDGRNTTQRNTLTYFTDFRLGPSSFLQYFPSWSPTDLPVDDQ